MQAISIVRARTIADHLGAPRPRQSPKPKSGVTPLPPSSLGLKIHIGFRVYATPVTPL
jgi:hypothetical protein